MRKLKRESGQSLVEFALVLPLLLLILIGILNFGEVLASQLLVQNIARNGAREAALGDSTSKVKAQLISDVENNAFLGTIGCYSANPSCQNLSNSINVIPGTPTSGGQSTTLVSIRYGVQLWGPISSAIMGDPYFVYTSVTMLDE